LYDINLNAGLFERGKFRIHTFFALITPTRRQYSFERVEDKRMSLEAEFHLAGSNTYLRIDLDAILHNWNLLQNMCSQNTGRSVLFCYIYYTDKGCTDTEMSR